MKVHGDDSGAVKIGREDCAPGGGRHAGVVLISLPGGFHVSGVVSWAVRLVNGLAAKGWVCGLVVHNRRVGYGGGVGGEGQPEKRPWVDPRVEVVDLSGIGDFDSCGGELGGFVEGYVHAAKRLVAKVSTSDADVNRGDASRRVFYIPNLIGDSYGIGAALSQRQEEIGAPLSVIGWSHLDSVYERHVIGHYEPLLAQVVGVSDRIVGALEKKLGAKGKIRQIGYGVPVPAAMVERKAEGGPRILYCGRLDESIKRVSSVLWMHEGLRASGVKGVEHELTIAGEGPAREELARGIAKLGEGANVKLLGACSHDEVEALYRTHDYFVLPSRAEGMSLAMLEAMAQGCIPVVARTESGAGQAIEDGVQGLLVDVSPQASSEETGRGMAEVLAGQIAKHGRGQEGMRCAGWERARGYSIDKHVDAVAGMLGELAERLGDSRVVWPMERACAFSGRVGVESGKVNVGGSGSVPPDGAARLERALREVGTGRAVIHGTGAHSRELRHVLEAHSSKIAAYCDEDPSKVGGEFLGKPVIAPGEVAGLWNAGKLRSAGRLGGLAGPDSDQSLARVDCVIISSWIHQEEIRERAAGLYPGLEVVALYDVV